MNFQDWLNSVLGRKIDLDGWFGAQCVDLFEHYNKNFVGAPRVGGNGWEIYGRASGYYYQKLPNTLTFVPKAGDVVVWGQKLGIYGHVAVCTGVGNVFGFESVDQNFPNSNGTTPAKKVWHSYFGVIGFLRPIKLVKAATPVFASSFSVRVDKPQAAVRAQATSKSALAGSQYLYKGDIFKAVALVEGESVLGNNKWYKSAKGNYVWSGGLTKI